MSHPKVTKTLLTGLVLAVGLFIGNAVVVPLISDRTPLAGATIGVIAGFIVLVIYACIAIAQSRRDRS